MSDIEAMKKRNEERNDDWCPLDRGGCGAKADIDALLAEIAARDAEIERLRDALEREFFGLACVKETADVLGIEEP